MGVGGSFSIPYGERDGVLVHVAEVERGLKCRCMCPVCRGPLVARKGERTKHHFGHYPGANCSAETVLHQLGKRVLHDRISAAVSSNLRVPMTWKCARCPDQHDADLASLADRVCMELDLGLCRPDVVLLKSDGSPAAFVEVVVSHRPDDNVLAYVGERGITLVQFHVRSSEDLEHFGQSDVLMPTAVSLCTRPQCSQCNQPLGRKRLHAVDAACWRCGSQMKVAILDVDGMPRGPESFGERDLFVAREHGVILQENYSRTVGERYLSSTCSQCGAFVGDFYLHDYWCLMAPENGHATGHVCLKCNKHYL